MKDNFGDMNPKKNIVIVYHTLPLYRSDFFNLLNEKLIGEDRKLVVIAGTTMGLKEIKEIDGEYLLSIDRYERVGFSLLGIQVQWGKGLIRKVFAYQPENVIFMYNAGIVNYSILMLLLRVKKIPYMIWGSGHRRRGLSDFQYKVKSFFKNIFMKMASGHITYSEYYARQLEEEGYGNEKIFCAQNTINIEEILYNQKRIGKRGSNAVVKFLFVGVLIPQKNLDKAILVCKKLKDDKFLFVFDVIGDGLAIDDLSEMIENLDLQEVVFLHGPKYGEEVAMFFREADVFVLPGTGGLAINEAMAYGLPIIATPGDGTGYDLIQNGENGFLLEFEYELNELYDAMKYFLVCEKSVRYKMGEKSLEMVKRKASLNNMVDRFFEAVRSVSRLRITN